MAKKKKCSRCHIPKDVSDFYQAKNKSGLQAYCKQCSKEKSTEWRRKNGIPPLQRKKEYVLPDFKFCSRCKKRKKRDDFRKKWDRRQNPPILYLNSTCRKCDAEISNENYRKNRKSPEYLKKKAKWARDNYLRNREKLIEYNRKRRSTPQAKAKMKAYRKKNKEKIYQQEVITKRRYHQKNRDGLTDKYISGLLRGQGIKEPTVEQIEIKRSQVLISRIKEKVRNAQKKPINLQPNV